MLKYFIWIIEIFNFLVKLPAAFKNLIHAST